MTTRIRLMSPADFAFADQVRACAGWNQTFSDWERFLAVEPSGCFIAEEDGAPAGTATCTSYDLEAGWVGMLLVHLDHRRRGIGTALLEHCLAYFDRRGTRCVKLDATPLGQPLYESHGFVPEQSLARWEVEGLELSPTVAFKDMTPWTDTDLEEAVALDQRAFGLNRRKVIGALSSRCAHAVACRAPRQNAFGFGLLREGSRAYYLGPVCAATPEIGKQIVRYLLSRVLKQPVFWDIPDANQAARALAQELGFQRQRPLLRMSRGKNPGPGNPALQFAIIDPAVG
jgi:GNAT superfamily N-acetyltransferase